MYHTTGFYRDEVVELCALIYSSDKMGRSSIQVPPILGLFHAVVITLTYLRRNRVQQELAEQYGVSQPTISRAISVLRPVIAELGQAWIPVTEDLSTKACFIVDGTLLPCWSWRDYPELYSGKHQRTGMNVQVACDLNGNLAWISDPVEGRRHDSAALKLSGVLDTFDPQHWIGDKGYTGKGMITPLKKTPKNKLNEAQKLFNTSVHAIRYKIEQVIANLKTWRILHTDYRRPFKTFTQTITAVIGLHFHKLTTEQPSLCRSKSPIGAATSTRPSPRAWRTAAVPSWLGAG